MNDISIDFNSIYDHFFQLHKQWEEDEIPKEMILHMTMLLAVDIAMETHSKEEAMQIFYRVLENYNRSYC